MESFWSSSNILKIFLKWKLHIIIITFLGMLIIGASTYLIKPKFKSIAIAYPVNLSQYSDEEHSEQMIQILNSRNIMDSVIHKFDLAKHYEIDSAYVHFQSTMYDTYNENVSISKTQYDAVQIKVFDTSPDTAALIANSILDFYNKKVRSLHKEKFKEVMDLYYSDMVKWENIKDSINNIITPAKDGLKINIIDNKLTNNKLTNNKIYRSIDKQLKIKNSKGGNFLSTDIELINAIDMLNKSKVKYEKYKREYNKKIKFYGLVTEAYPADLKSSPKRIIITLLGGLSVFILVILTIGFIENKKINV